MSIYHKMQMQYGMKEEILAKAPRSQRTQSTCSIYSSKSQEISDRNQNFLGIKIRNLISTWRSLRTLRLSEK